MLNISILLLTAMEKINYHAIERKWQTKWNKSKIFEANIDKNKPKFFVTFPYPYLNLSPHIGAAFTAFRCDSYARFKRMQGFNVLYPQGFHATGEPILGAIERLKQNDKTQIETFKLGGASDKDIKNFIKYGPEFTAKFWMKCWVEDLKLSGFSIDWRRTFITTTMTPTYSRFVEWQYNTLRKKGYVVQGTHPVVWCPNCKSPTGDHDRLKGEGESPIEYVTIKFKLNSGEILPCGTLRPETIFGVTNIWVNSEVEYKRVKIGNETWIISEKATEKLKDQLKDVQMISRIRGSELIGKYCENPVLKNKILVLPAGFVDPNAATGIVMSVPSHAPYDWIGLRDLQRNPEELREYDIEPKVILNIKPISIIKTPEFGEQPAIEVCEKMGIENQNEKEKLDEATSLVYKKEFHLGVLKDNCREYSGQKVSELKESLTKEFIDKGIADSIWEITGPVVCRCTTPNHVKILENQWFLKFSDENWKKKVKQCISRMKFYPEDVRLQFENTIDWLKDKACTRRTGLGTPLPWDKEWIVETLSDSTIYMAYYTIARILNEKKIKAEQLTDEVFDYIFLGKGNSKELSEKNGIDKKIIEEMKGEFEYFYPVDLRNSGKDLVQNHLTFYIFHHTAIWDNPGYWPKAIGVNGYVNVLGTKMSKSKGNIIPLRGLIDAIGADLVRINIVASNEGLNDADWRDESVPSYSSRLQFLYDLISKLNKAKRNSFESIDSFLQSITQNHIKTATESYEQTKFRSAMQSALFDFTNDLKLYIERTGGVKNCNKKVLKNTLSCVVRLIAPVVPHITEEMWEKIRGKGFISLAEWPKANERLIDKNILELEEIFKKVLEDLNHVIKLVGKKKSAYLYFATKKELDYFNESLEFVKKQFGFEKLKAFLSSDPKRYDPQKKAEKSKYGKPGIYLE